MTDEELLQRFKPMAARMLEESGSWDDCPFCGGAYDRKRIDAGDPTAFHTSDCILREFANREPDDALHLVIDKEVIQSVGATALGQSLVNTFAMNVATEFAKKATQARTRACPKCGAVVGEWCKLDDKQRPTVCKERLGQ